MEIQKQIKFAIVMYGGGSLAIYINGVAQELLKLHQATANSDEFSGMNLVYRKIALLLSGKVNEFNQIQTLQKDPKNNKVIQQLLRTYQPSVKFVIDVLTGSSAGGINAIFLAKALANGTKSISNLQSLWIEQGDFAKLLNDKQSVKDNNLEVPREPNSLLNSQRMYLELLKALKAMDTQADAKLKMQQPLDLFVTYTDFRGVPIQLALSDKIVLENSHRRVFNFRYKNNQDPKIEIDDFTSKNNAFLAFAARCTSSFPAAFEPMCFKEIENVIKTSPHLADKNTNYSNFRQYFPDLKDENGADIEWKDRYFVDGGALDNKPFSYAIDKITQRVDTGIIERKLLYIEPDPEDFQKIKKGKQINALDNVLGQASNLPRYETIREDLRRILEHNRLIERVERLTKEVENDFDNVGLQKDGIAKINWSDVTLEELVKAKGAAFLPYLRLRVSSTSDYIARLVTKCFKIDEDSDSFKSIRCLIWFWREKNFSGNNKKDNKKSLNTFLYDYDVEYRLRRLRFVLQKVEYLLNCRKEILSNIKQHSFDSNSEDNSKTPKINEDNYLVLSSKLAIIAALPADDDDKRKTIAKNFNDKNYLDAVYGVQKELNQIYAKLRQDYDYLEEVLSSEVKNEFQEFQVKLDEVQKELKKLSKNNDSKKALQQILEQIIYKNQASQCSVFNAENESETLLRGAFSVNPENPANLQPLLNSLNNAANYLSDEVLNKVDLFLRLASKKAKVLLEIKDSKSKSPTKEEKEALGITFDDSTVEAKFVQNFLRNYYILFDSYDQISFPIYYESPVGEAVKVDVIRISSRDAHSLINEEKEERRKLAGDALLNFGAFLDPRWRLNDIMWGRLDGAERLITTLLKDEYKGISTDQYKKIRDDLIKEANQIILDEMLVQTASEGFQNTLVGALSLASREEIDKDAVEKFVANLPANELGKGLRTALINTCDKEKLYEHFKKSYEVDLNLDSEATLKMMSRATQIGGKIMEKIAEENNKSSNYLGLVSRAGQVLGGLAAVAAPTSIWNLLFYYWVSVLFVFEIIVIVGATIFANSSIQQFGITALILTLITYLAVITLQDRFSNKKSWKTVPILFGGVFVTLCTLFGVFMIYSIFFDANTWNLITNFQGLVSSAKFERFQKLIPLIPFIILFAFILLWREIEKLNLKAIGITIIIGFLIVTGFQLYFDNLVGTTFVNSSNQVEKYHPIMQLEFVSNAQDINTLIGKVGSNLEGLKTAIWVDTFAFIPFYVGFLLLLMIFLGQRKKYFETWTAVFSIIFLLLAGAFDLLENYFSLIVLNATTITDEMATNISTPAKIKWVLVFGVIGIISLIFLRKIKLSKWNLVMVLMIIAAIAGIIGTLFQPNPVITIALSIEFIILLGVGISFMFRKVRENFLEDF